MVSGDQINRQTSLKTNTMNERAILKNLLSIVTPRMHKVRRQALQECTNSLLNGAHASVTSIGRGIDSSSFEKHKIKRADRLLSNKSLQYELPIIYQAMCTQFVDISSQPIILVDWSDLDTHKGCFLLRASVVFSGRGIAIYQEVHGANTKESRVTHNAFLGKLKDIISRDSTPIIVTDAGYKTTWFKAVTALGWHFVGRVRSPMKYLNSHHKWEHTTQLYQKANIRPKCFSSYICERTPMPCQLTLYKGKSKGRHSLTRLNVRRQSKTSLVHAKGATDPWVLATSLPHRINLGRKLVKIYRLRMQIEEEFRDIKSSLFGLGFEHHKSRAVKRIAILILIATLASITATLIGIAMTIQGLNRRYQANTVSSRRVLSYHYIGLRGCLDKSLKLPIKQYEIAIRFLQQAIREACYE
ncbi:MAG: IS4 family transposase [Glaciecola sp.]|jgi:hypothetical protein